MVTGGTRGIGSAVARRMAAAGHAVAVVGRSAAPCDGLLSVPCDVTDPAQVDRAFGRVERTHGPVRVLVAGAGLRRDRLLVQMTDADFDAVVAGNLTGTFYTVRRALPGMLRARHGRIVIISSALGLTGSPGQANYAAAKAGLVGMARSLAREVAGRGITVNVVAPGLVDTALTADLSPRQRDAFLARTPLRRPITPQEVAAAVHFLTQDCAAAVTGAVLPVDGGFGMGH
ncbi:SDR family oxidoreductase [Actinomadura rubteroloni]|nr:SDR family oxidoreductase [Actinomadura rubteroloni]